MKSATENTKKSASVMVDIDYDAISKNSAKNKLNSNFPVYDDDIFDGLPGLKSKSMSSSGLPSFEENVFGKSSQQSDDFDEFLGSLSRKQKGESIKDDSSKSLIGFDDLIPGFGSGNAAFNNRSSSEPTSKSTANTKETSNAMDDPFVVLESTSSTTDAYQSFSTDPPEEIGNISKSGTSQNRGSSVSGSLFEDIDPLNGFGNSVPAFTSETNNREKDQGPLKEGSGMGRAQSSVSKDSTQKASFRYSESRSPVSDFQESHRTVFDIPEVSRSHNRSFDQSTSSPSYIETSSQTGHRADEIWLTVSEIPLFTQPTRTPPPLRPPPPIPRHISKPKRVSLRSNSRKVVNGFSSPKFATSRIPNDSGDYADDQSAEERDSALAAAAMKEAMDRAEAKFRHAKEVRERENSKASRNKERMQSDKNEQREKEEEEEEREKRRLEKERIREVERQKARQAVERAIREARERAAFEARERASVEARLKSERDAVQRAQAEARERAAVGARDRAERAATEAKQKAEEDVRRKAERAAVERVAFEARKRAAVDARERAAASRMNQQKNGNDLESFFSNSSRSSSSPRPRETSSLSSKLFFDSTSDPLSQNRPDGAHRTSTAGVSSNLRRASSTTNIVDDLSSIFGAAPTSGHFQEVEGETEERRRARLEREQRTQERTAKALAEKNQRDLQSQREQEERHRFGGTLDTEVKRWAAGKEGNLRALLSTLQYILWPESGWQPVSLTDLITGANVKKAYRKATLCIHPDKVQQKGANLQQKYVAEKVFDILKEAWNKFNSEELF